LLALAIPASLFRCSGSRMDIGSQGINLFSIENLCLINY
jgi:hypothetical protein